MLIEQLIDFRKVRTENLNLRTDLRDQVMGGWSVTQYMIVYKSRLLKNLHIKKQSLFCQCQSLHPFKFEHHTLHRSRRRSRAVQGPQGHVPAARHHQRPVLLGAPRRRRRAQRHR